MANHTSPIDVIILASDGCYAMVTIVFPGTKWRKITQNKTFTLGSSPTAAVCWDDGNSCVAIFVFVLIGRANPWRLDGGHSEIHGQSLSTHLV